MHITKLEIKNCLTVGQASMELDNRGLLLIQGVNGDDPSAESNGAGKSSIVDSLCWSLYGVTARGVTADAVVNRTAKKDCRVHVEIEDGSIKYHITRYRKDKTNKNAVFVSSETAGIITDLSKGTDKETQDVINKIMGCSLEVFMGAVYAGQERMPDLPGMTDKALKMLIEEAAGVEVLTEAYGVARLRFNIVKAKLDSASAATASLGSQLASANDILDGQKVQNALFESGRKDRAKAELAKAVPLKAKLAEIERLVAAFPAAPLVAQLAELEGKLKEKSAEEAEYRILDAKSLASSNAVIRLRAQLEIAKRRFDDATKSLAEVDGQVGKPCGECGKHYGEDDIVGAREARRISVEKAKTELRPIVAALKQAVEGQEASFEAANKFSAAMTDYTAVAALQRDLSGRIHDVRMSEMLIESTKKEIEGFGSIAKMKLAESNPWTNAIKSTEDQIAALDSKLEQSQKEAKSLSVDVELLADAVKVFGPAGVRAHILDTVTPYLNARTQEYLGALADGNIHAEWSTLTTNAKGELKEKFNIDVTNDKGAESFAGLSGGEKRKVRIATAMALQDMVASRATKPINIFIADEVDHALDKSGLERLMGVLERKARERGTVLVISHNSLSDWCDNVVTVTKNGGVATVSGMAMRDF